MAKLTNKLGLPQAIVDAVKNDDYSKGKSDISITGLIRPPRIRVLTKLHDSDIEYDVTDKIFSLLGQVVHGILERANKKGLSETRFYLELEGLCISGEEDVLYDNGILQDYKLTSLYQVKNGVPLDFEQQLNCYNYLIKHGYYYKSKEDEKNDVRSKCDIIPTRLQDIIILRDWGKGKAQRDSTLPQQQVLVLDVSMWKDEKTLEFLKTRIALHKAANKKLPLCTVEERWASPDKWAVMSKPEAAKSLKNHEDIVLAELHLANVLKKYPKAFIEDRPGFNTRCDGNYCGVSKVCKQYQQLRKGLK